MVRKAHAQLVRAVNQFVLGSLALAQAQQGRTAPCHMKQGSTQRTAQQRAAEPHPPPTHHRGHKGGTLVWVCVARKLQDFEYAQCGTAGLDAINKGFDQFKCRPFSK
jgi:hypothetical protein